MFATSFEGIKILTDEIVAFLVRREVLELVAKRYSNGLANFFQQTRECENRFILREFFT